MLASRYIKAGEELTFGYLDVLHLLEKRREMAASWGFGCSCRRCEFEESVCRNPELKDVEIGVESVVDEGKIVFGLEVLMKTLVVRGKEKGYLRASFCQAYGETYMSEGLLKRWERRIPTAEAVTESIAEAVGSDEKVLKVLMSNQSRNGCGGGIVEMEEYSS